MPDINIGALKSLDFPSDMLLYDDLDSFTISVDEDTSFMDDYSTFDPFELSSDDILSSESNDSRNFSRRLGFVSSKIREVIFKASESDQPILTSKVVCWARNVANDAIELLKDEDDTSNPKENLSGDVYHSESSFNGEESNHDTQTMQLSSPDDDMGSVDHSVGMYSHPFGNSFDHEDNDSWNEGRM